MSGRILASIIVALTVIAGVSIYWLQVYAYYDEVSEEAVGLTLVSLATDAPEPLAVDDFRAIDATSSPLRFRACFTPLMSDTTLSETYTPYPNPTPLTAPRWFDCFDAVEIGEALEAGEAMAFLSQHDIHDGVDRVVAVFPDGRGFAWHQLNEKYADE